MAIMLLENDVFIEQFTEEKIASPRVLELVSKINIRHDESLDNAPSGTIARESIVEITLKNGERITQRGSVRGYEGNPVTENEVIEKFRKTSQDRITADQQDELIDLCMRLDELPDARALVKLLEVRSQA